MNRRPRIRPCADPARFGYHLSSWLSLKVSFSMPGSRMRAQRSPQYSNHPFKARFFSLVNGG